jgi:membrane protease YdiL (CAAX protease family)
MKDYSNGFSADRGLFGLAADSKVNRNFIWFSIFAYMVMIAGGGLVGIATEIARISGMSEYWTTFFDLVLGFGTILLLVYLIVRFREKRLFRDIGFQKEFVGNYFKGFAVGIFLMLICISLMTVFGGMELVIKAPNTGIKVLPSVLIILFGWIIQGGTEEVLTRGWMLPLLGRRYNVPFAIGVTSIFFMILHSGNNGMTLMPILNLVLFGIFAALFVVNEKSIWGICGMHSAWNWMQGNILGISVSGTDPVGGSLLKFAPKGNELLSGGIFGVEGSIVCTLVFLLASIYLIKIIKEEK